MLDSHDTSAKPKERVKAMEIKKQIENFYFVFMLIVQSKILQILNILSKAMQCKTIDLSTARKLSQIAVQDIAQLKRSFDVVIKEPSSIACQWGWPRQFLNKSVKKTKTYFDEISEEISLSNPKKRFCVTVFLLIMLTKRLAPIGCTKFFVITKRL